MVNLPLYRNLPIENLAACFNNVTNSYKYFWFLAILEYIRETQSNVIPIYNLLARMIAGVWYPTNYYRLSFGKQDRLSQIAVKVGNYASLPMDTKQQTVITAIKEHLSSDIPLAHEIQSLGEYVPYRFLRPFFTQQLRGLADWVVNERIRELSSQSFISQISPCIYRFISHPTEAIEVHSEWFIYVRRHLAILRDFCLWNLVTYIQKNNPNVPNIPYKLLEPTQRNLRQARAFWDMTLDKFDGLICIYSGQRIPRDKYSLDHFLPWRYVAHDLLWNIIPTIKNANSAKSDNLPDLNRYFDPFAKLQYNAVQTLASFNKPHLLEDHILLTGVDSIDELQCLSFDDFRKRLHDSIAPQFQIAINMGFTSNWSYS